MKGLLTTLRKVIFCDILYDCTCFCSTAELLIVVAGGIARPFDIFGTDQAVKIDIPKSSCRV